MLQYCDSFCHPSVSISYTYMCLLLKDNFKLKSMNHELPDIQAGFRKGRGTRDQISAGSWKKQERSRKASISALLTMPKPLTVWITINRKILKEMHISDHLICLLRNLYAG